MMYLDGDIKQAEMLDLSLDMNVYSFPLVLRLSHLMGLGITYYWGMSHDSVKTFQFPTILCQA